MILRLPLPSFWLKSEPPSSRLKSVPDDAALDEGFPRDQNEDPDEDVESMLESSDPRGRPFTARGAASFLILRDEATADSVLSSRRIGTDGRARGFDGSAGRLCAVEPDKRPAPGAAADLDRGRGLVGSPRALGEDIIGSPARQRQIDRQKKRRQVLLLLESELYPCAAGGRKARVKGRDDGSKDKRNGRLSPNQNPN